MLDRRAAAGAVQRRARAARATGSSSADRARRRHAPASSSSEGGGSLAPGNGDGPRTLGSLAPDAARGGPRVVRRLFAGRPARRGSPAAACWPGARRWRSSYLLSTSAEHYTGTNSVGVRSLVAEVPAGEPPLRARTWTCPTAPAACSSLLWPELAAARRCARAAGPRSGARAASAARGGPAAARRGPLGRRPGPSRSCSSRRRRQRAGAALPDARGRAAGGRRHRRPAGGRSTADARRRAAARRVARSASWRRRTTRPASSRAARRRLRGAPPSSGPGSSARGSTRRSSSCCCPRSGSSRCGCSRRARPGWARARTAALTIAAVAILNAAAWALITPAWHGPDEPDHFAYAQTLAERGETPDKQESDTPPFSSRHVVALDATRTYSVVGLADTRPPWLAADEERYRADAGRRPPGARTTAAATCSRPRRTCPATTCSPLPAYLAADSREHVHRADGDAAHVRAARRRRRAVRVPVRARAGAAPAMAGGRRRACSWRSSRWSRSCSGW